MNMSWRPQVQLTQSISINAQVIQSIKLLQFNLEELSEFIKEQSERNPMIETLDNHGSFATKSREGSEAAGISGLGTSQFISRGARGAGRVSVNANTGDYRDIEDRVAASVSLRDHLRMQLGAAFSNGLDVQTAIEVIESLDDDGYLRRPLHTIADALGVCEARVEVVLANIQRMDPAGVGARSLGECLSLQLRETNLLTPPMERLLANLHLLATHEYRQLSSLCGVGVDEVVAMSRQIKRLDPRPGRRFDSSPIVPALPDVIVELLSDGSVITELNPQALPRVLVNRQYYSRMKTECRGAADVKFITDCMKEANWLVRNLDQRAQTILKVATEIMARQYEFLVHGIEYLKPLSLKDVADAVGVHQSTVCRAISNKYIMTPRGLRELKFFFANSIAAVDGRENVASDMVRHRIRQMIADETAANILSDDAIVKELRAEGVDIARRTVAKYREAMNIPSSLQRRRQKEAELAEPSRPAALALKSLHAAA